MELLKKTPIALAIILAAVLGFGALCFGANLTSGTLSTASVQSDSDSGAETPSADRTITLTVNWDDNGNAQGKRPDKVVFNVTSEITAEGEETPTTETYQVEVTGELTEASWIKKVSQLNNASIPADAKISVTQQTDTITEAGYVCGAVENTEDAPDVFAVTNSFYSGDIIVDVYWNDDDNRDGKRPALDSTPASELFTISANEESLPAESAINLADINPIERSGNNWRYVITPPATEADGDTVNYTVTAKNVDSYTSNTQSAANFVSISMTHEPEKKNVSGKIIWDDGDRSARPTSGTAYLFVGTGDDKEPVGNGIGVSAPEGDDANPNEWTWSFDDQYVYDKGEQIVYSTDVEFDNLDEHYAKTVNGNEITYSRAITMLTANVEFKDNNDADGLRGELFADGLDVQLCSKNADGITPLEGENYNKHIDITSDTNLFLVHFDNIPSKNSDGSAIEYVVRPVFENGQPEDYDITYNDDTWSMTFAHDTSKVAFQGIITWTGDNSASDARPDVELGLYRVSGEDDSKRTLIEQITVTKPGNDNPDDPTDTWNYRFTPVSLTDEGEQVKYTVDVIDPEDDFGRYTYSKYERPDTPYYTIFAFIYDAYVGPGKVNKAVALNWNDSNNINGDRPNAVKIQLYAGEGDNKRAIGEPVDLSDSNEANSAWAHIYHDLLAQDEDNNYIDYSVEVVSTDPESSAVRYNFIVNDDESSNTFSIDATYVPELTNVTGSITWNDNDNSDGVRPENLTVRLFDRLGNKVTEQVVSGEGGNWDFTFSNVPVKVQGEPAGYYIQIANLSGKYDPTYDGMNATCTYVPSATSRTITVKWVGGNMRYDITVQLRANGVAQGDQVTLTRLLDWTYEWRNLNERDNGELIDYTVSILGSSNPGGLVPGYVMSRSTDSAGNFIVTYTSISASFINIDGNTGEVLTGARYQLLDGNEVVAAWTSDTAPYKIEELTAGKTYILHEESPAVGHSAMADKEIIVDEDGQVTTSSSGISIENGVITIPSVSSTANFTGNVNWNLSDGFASAYKPFVVIDLYCDGNYTGRNTRVQGTGYTFSNLPQYGDNGAAYTYSVRARVERPNAAVSTWTASDWTVSVSGRDVNVTYDPEMTVVQGGITWVSDTTADRPSSVTINVLVNGRKYAQKTVMASDFWLYTVNDVPARSENGATNKVTISQNAVSGYSSTINGYYVTNTKTGSGSAVQAQLVENGIYYLESALSSNKVLDIAGGSSGNGANAQLWTKNNSNAQKFRITYNAASNTYTISCVNSNKMLDVNSARYANGTNIHQWDANGTNAQKWKIVKNVDGTYRIQAAGNANYVLDVNAGSTRDGANVQIWSYNGSKAQAWRLTKTTATETPSAKTIANGTYTLYSKVGTNKVLDISGASKNNCANAQIWTSNGSNAQKFTFTYDNNGYYTIKNVSSGKVLDAKCGGTANGTNVWQYASNGSDAQKWKVNKNSDGTYTIINKRSGKALDVNAGANKDGANVHLWASNGSSAQRWRIA